MRESLDSHPFSSENIELTSHTPQLSEKQQLQQRERDQQGSSSRSNARSIPSPDHFEEITFDRTPTPIPYAQVPPLNNNTSKSSAPSYMTHTSVRTPSNPPPTYPPSTRSFATLSDRTPPCPPSKRQISFPNVPMSCVYALYGGMFMLIILMGIVALIRRPYIGYARDTPIGILVDIGHGARRTLDKTVSWPKVDPVRYRDQQSSGVGDTGRGWIWCLGAFGAVAAMAVLGL